MGRGSTLGWLIVRSIRAAGYTPRSLRELYARWNYYARTSQNRNNVYYAEIVKDTREYVSIPRCSICSVFDEEHIEKKFFLQKIHLKLYHYKITIKLNYDALNSR